MSGFKLQKETDSRGQRSIRLSRSYRAIYVEEISDEVNLVVIEEVNKHEYQTRHSSEY